MGGRNTSWSSSVTFSTAFPGFHSLHLGGQALGWAPMMSVATTRLQGTNPTTCGPAEFVIVNLFQCNHQLSPSDHTMIGNVHHPGFVESKPGTDSGTLENSQVACPNWGMHVRGDFCWSWLRTTPAFYLQQENRRGFKSQHADVLLREFRHEGRWSQLAMWEMQFVTYGSRLVRASDGRRQWRWPPVANSRRLAAGPSFTYIFKSNKPKDCTKL